MVYLSDDIRREVRTRLAVMRRPVRLLVFSRGPDCESCEATRALLDEVAELSDLLSVQAVDVGKERQLAGVYGIDKTPAIAVLAGAGDAVDTGMRFFGVPAGYEFMSLLEAVLFASTGEPGLSSETLAWLAKLDEPLHLQVFVTPT